MEVNTKQKTGYVVLATALDYNDEIYYQLEGYNLNDKQVYATYEEASDNIIERIDKDFSWMRLCELWYDGEEPPLVNEYVFATHEDHFENLHDLDDKVSDFVAWCIDNDKDYTDALHLYNIVKVTIA